MFSECFSYSMDQSLILVWFCFYVLYLDFPSGMGCGASLISIDLARNMLQRQPGKALVISTEIITPNLYTGNERRFLLQNTLFRCGGAAMVLSNKWTDGRKALYKLLHLVRVQVRKG